MKPNKYFIAFSFILYSLIIFAQETVKYGNDYLAIGVGARAHGMGKAVIANTSDGYSSYWNPAGLALLPYSFQVNLMHAEWFAGIAKFDYVSFAKKIGNEQKSSIAVSIIRLGIDDIPYTFDLVGADGSINPDLVTGFSYADYASFISYARQLKAVGLRIGGSAKIIYRNAGQFGKAWGFGADIGLQYDYKQRWKFGFMARDITSTFNAWSFSYTEEEIATLLATGNEISDNSIELITPRFIMGTAFSTRTTQKEKIGLLVELDLDFTTDGQRNVLVNSSLINIAPRLGIEFDYQNIVFLRAGINNFQNINDDNGQSSIVAQPNMGIGILVGKFKLDYALNNVGSAGSTGNFYSHIISVSINFKEQNKNKAVLDQSKEKKNVKNTTSNYPDYIEQID